MRFSPLSVSPNPFNPSVEFRLPGGLGDESVLEIYDISGRKVRDFSAACFAGDAVIWDGTDDNGKGLPSGVYFARLKYGGGVFSAKVTLLK